MQYYLTLDNPKPGFDACFESSAFANSSDELAAIERQLGIKNHFEFFSYAPQADLFPEGSEETDTPWFRAQEGIEWLEVLLIHLRQNPLSVQQHEQLIEDFEVCNAVLIKANSIGANWHFEMDI